jgi:hypothetical protein
MSFLSHLWLLAECVRFGEKLVNFCASCVATIYDLHRSKEFKDYPTPREQISRLREILKDLGMPSRPSMAEAKKIKERRELMQDVGMFSSMKFVCCLSHLTASGCNGVREIERCKK